MGAPLVAQFWEVKNCAFLGFWRTQRFFKCLRFRRKQKHSQMLFQWQCWAGSGLSLRLARRSAARRGCVESRAFIDFGPIIETIFIFSPHGVNTSSDELIGCDWAGVVFFSGFDASPTVFQTRIALISAATPMMFITLVML